MGSLQNLSNSHIPYRILIETLKNVCRILYLSLSLSRFLSLALALARSLSRALSPGYTHIFNIQYSYTMESHYTLHIHTSYTMGSLRIVLIQYLWNQQIANTNLFGVSGGCWSHCRRRCVLRLAGAAQRVRPAQRPGQRRWPTHRAFVSWRGRGGAPAEYMQLVHVSQP